VAQLQPIERRLAGYWGTLLTPCRQLARQHGHYRIVPQIIVVVEVLIAERDAKYPLLDERCDLVLDQLNSTGNTRATGKAVDQDPCGKEMRNALSALAELRLSDPQANQVGAGTDAEVAAVT
jgi:hypothetical protein